MFKSQGKKVFVAMSGGVDSSVSAALLQKEGYDVTGVFMKVWQPDFLSLDPARDKECQTNDRLDAMRVAAHLGIPFLTFDFEKEYKEEVIDYMVSEYTAGRTPNPDVMCNKTIKFGVFLKKALAMGADMIATGHYARVGVSVKRLAVRRNKLKLNPKRYTLYAGHDSAKDQSYFLWTLAQEQLRRVLFPVGGYKKPEVRELARKFGLPNAERKESQGLCFVGKMDMKEFLKHYIQEKRGDVFNERGEIIGYHDGVFFLTIGQRHGFLITKKTPTDAPYYVIAKDVLKNTIVVSHTKFEENAINEVVLHNVSWVSEEAPDTGREYQARVRYRQPLQSCRIEAQKNADSTQTHAENLLAQYSIFKVHFSEPQEAITPGQSLVLYDPSTVLGAGGEECIGGGVIA